VAGCGGLARKAEKAQAEGAQGRELAVIYTGDRQLVAVRHDALAALELANRPPRYFRRAGRVSRLWVSPETKRPAFEPLSPKELRGVLAQVAVWKKKARGGREAVARLLSRVYAEMRRLTPARVTRQPPGHTVQTTALAHEACLRLVGEADLHLKGRMHFFFAAAWDGLLAPAAGGWYNKGALGDQV
jgi:hypothetical protein